MDKFYTFCLGISIGLSVAFFTSGKFWLGVIAGIPLGAVLLVCIIAIIIAIADNDMHQLDDGTGDGYRN